jgi:hypothetical protein
MNRTPHMPLRRCLRYPIPEIEQAASLLTAAMTARPDGRRADAIDLISAANLNAVRGWLRSFGINCQPLCGHMTEADSPVSLPNPSRPIYAGREPPYISSV